MMPPSNTPPNGDFAAYVERLEKARLATGPGEAVFQTRTESRPNAGDQAKAGKTSHRVSSPPATPTSFLTHANWVFVAWIALQALAKVVPGAGYLFVPVLIGYAAWFFFRQKGDANGAVTSRFRALAKQAVEEARKSRFPS